jgi:hypothetical protein
VKTNRRTFLRTGLFGGALLALGGAGLALYPTRHVASPLRPLRVLDDRGFQVLVAIARRVIVDPGADGAAIAQGVDELASRMPREVQRDINRLLGLFESALGGLLLDGRATPFTRLSPEAQDGVLAKWRSSRLALRRGGYQGLRKLCSVAHYMEPWSWAAIGFPAPTPVGEPYDDSKMGTPEWLKAHDLEGVP